ncbi:MAG: UDP-4-amino-4,6-dideoxy-N-acetyl-beta-L-altrosamine transaminase [Elusimicrobiales bacterium]
MNRDKTKNLRFLGYGRQYIDHEDARAAVRALRSDWLTQGPGIEEFEAGLRRITGAEYAVAVANGTAALHIAALAAGLKPGDEAITSAMTFAASCNCIAYAGAKPVFADIEPDTYNISPAEIERRLNPRVKAVIPVDFAGRPADMEEICALARPRGMTVIEDAAQAIGSRYRCGAAVGSCKYADMTTFSFHPVKNITTGEGGAVTTNDKKLYQTLLLLRTHGITKDPAQFSLVPDGPWHNEMQILGFNYRLSEIHAAVGTSQLAKLSRFILRRREIAAMYDEAFAPLDFVRIPRERPGGKSAIHIYAPLFDFARIGKTRAEVFSEFASRWRIGLNVHYIPPHLHPYYRQQYGYKPGDYPNAEYYYSRAVSLPLFYGMTNAEARRVTDAVRSLGTR